MESTVDPTIKNSRPATHNLTDIEKQASTHLSTPSSPSSPSPQPTSPPLLSHLRQWNAHIESLSGFEARGITRVLPSERQTPSRAAYLQMVILWFGVNITINNLVVGLYGPLLFQLGFLDASLCAVGGVALGAACTAYMSTWGAVSGCRTLVVVRFFMGYWPSRICVLLNVILMEGYCTVTAIIGGQILAAVSGGTMTIAVGIVVVSIAVMIVAVVGLKVFHVYERYAWLPQILALSILIGSAGPSFSTSLASAGSPAQIAANRLSFFSLCFYVPTSWGAASSDYYVYYPEKTSKWKTFFLTWTGLTFSFCFVDMLGIGIASGIATHPEWEDAYNISIGALLTVTYAPLGHFGNFCAVVLALGLIANSIPGTYSAALNCQMMGRAWKVVPRWIWTVALVVVQLACALAGRNKVFVVFQNLLALMGYWLTIMICIVAEEHVLFQKARALAIDWAAWEEQRKLPVGVAALVAFLLGWMGAILGMYQVWYVGPLAKLVADTGADVGVWVGCGFALVAFPPLRLLELRLVGR
ncbi:Purine-cytosine permease fcyB 3 [Paraphaeosphaeria sporulosa]